MIQILMMAATYAASEYKPQNGDIIFQTSESTQSQLIQVVTQSPYSHVGLVTIRDGAPYVFEAIKTVQLTPLDAWVARGKEGQYTILRTKTPLTPEQLKKMEGIAQSYQGKNYDLPFQWSDNQMYCSELVWKIYANGADIILVEPRKMVSYAGLTSEASKVMEERWGNNLFYDEFVVAPSDIAESFLLETIYTSFH